MRHLKVCLFAAVVAAALAGTVLLMDTVSSGNVAAQEKVRESYWRHHDGHWSYWYAPDRRWYYTDGTNWFYNGDEGWNVYRFDHRFGREGFERGEFRPPAPDVKIVVPRHRVFRD